MDQKQSLFREEVGFHNLPMNTSRVFEFGIIGDDLTSAADGASAFATYGQVARICRGRPPSRDALIVAVDCGSRAVGEPEAVRRVSDSTLLLKSKHILYKTVDSTLRGHVKAELAACLQVSGRKTLVFGPAFPAAGRTTVAGIQLVDGIPVAESSYGSDPVHPARHSSLAELVPDSATDVLILNASTQDELDAKVAALPEPQNILWAGSPGMAMALASRFALSSDVPVTLPRVKGGFLIVVGSANERSHCQANAVAQHPDVTVLCAPRERRAEPKVLLWTLAEQSIEVLRTRRISVVIATGGDTMEAILDRLGVGEFEILHEIAPGFPLGRALLDNGSELLIAMKAGGFGDDQVLVRAVTRLRATSAVAHSS